MNLTFSILVLYGIMVCSLLSRHLVKTAQQHHKGKIAVPIKRRSSMRAGQISIRAGQIIAYLQSLWPSNTGYKFPIGSSKEMQIQEQHQYDQMFPKCELMPLIMGSLSANQTPNFFVRKSYKYLRTDNPNEGGLRRIVIYLATVDDLGNDVKSHDDVLGYLRTKPEWLSFSACSNDKIVSLRTNDQVHFSDGRVISARKCGMASLLAYLCFMDSDYLTNGKGFLVANDPNWNDGNMPAILGLGFNNQGCKRMIRADSEITYYFETTPQYQQDRHSWPGNKALIYGAHAAYFTAMVSYNPNPCKPDPQGQERQVCCMVDHPIHKGNCFDTSDLIESINLRDPKPTKIVEAQDVNKQIHLGLDNFMEHYGRTWYFCRRINFRADELQVNK